VEQVYSVQEIVGGKRQIGFITGFQQLFIFGAISFSLTTKARHRKSNIRRMVTESMFVLFLNDSTFRSFVPW